MSQRCRAQAEYGSRQGWLRQHSRPIQFLIVLGMLTSIAPNSAALVLWSDLGATLAHNTGPGVDVLGGALKRDNTAADTLYFRFHVDPMSDVATEEYSAALQLFLGDRERLGIGNSLKAWAYSAFNTSASGEFNRVFGDIDLASARPESSAPGEFLPYELPRRGIGNTIVFKVQYLPNAEDEVTVWLSPDLTPGATEQGQDERRVTRFKADASFDSIRLRHDGGGSGWTFSDMAVATSFHDFVLGSHPGETQPSTVHSWDPVPYTFRNWQREQGLPQYSVQALAQTKDGYLWIGGNNGLTRFDGVRFTSFGPREGWRGGAARVLLEDNARRLWIGTAEGGLACLVQGRVTNYSREHGLAGDTVHALAQDHSGRLWIGTDSGLTVWDNQQPALTAMTGRFRDHPVKALFLDSQGGMWIGATGLGVFHFEREQLTQATDPGVSAILQDPHCILRDRAGRLWVGAAEDFILCRDKDEWRRYRIPRQPARSSIISLIEEPEGTVWAGSLSQGLFQFKTGKLTQLNAASGLPDNTIQTLLNDAEGNIWVGSGAGLTRLRRKSLAFFAAAQGLGHGAAYGISEVAPGVIWVCKPGEGLYRWQGRRFTQISAPENPEWWVDARVLLAAEDGSCLAGGKGLFRFPVTNVEKPTLDSFALPGLTVISLAQSRDRSIWAGTHEGQLWQKRENSWMGHSNAFQAKPISAVLPDAADHLWVGTDGAGLFRARGDNPAVAEKVTGLLSERIRALHLDREETVWVGTAFGGLGRWQSNKLAVLTTREGLPDNTISQIVEDQNGCLWLGTSRGIMRAPKAELNAVADGRSSGIFPQVFGRSDGMISEECTGGVFPSAMRSKGGWLWFPTTRGVVALDPRPSAIGIPPPRPILEQVLVDGTSRWTHGIVSAPTDDQSGSPSLRLGPGRRRIEFHYTGLNLAAPEQVRFRYKLEGLDPEWVEAGDRRTAFYGYVPPGQYRFLVAAYNSHGVTGPSTASLALTIQPQFWQTRLFFVAAAISLVVSIGGMSRLIEKRRMQARLRRLESERAVERERARIAQDLHDDLGSSLTRISLLSDLVNADRAHPEAVANHAQKISASAAQTVRSLEEIVWALRPGSDSLQSLVQYIAHFTTELFEGDTAHARLDLPHDLPPMALPPELRHNIFLIIKEALTNARKHARAREVRVQAKVAGNFLEFVVEDDGRGFVLPTTPATGIHRNGLGNMQRRAEAAGGKIAIQSRPDQGTSIRLRVPLPESGQRNLGPA